MSERDSRAKLLGELIKNARLHADRSQAECAEVLGVSEEDFAQAEAGEYVVSLPDLEVLALYLEVPMGYFWGSEALADKPHVDYVNMTSLRHRVIGVVLRQLRIRDKRSTQDVAEELGVTVAEVEEYEAGEKPISYLHLETLSEYFNIPMSHFLESERGPLSRHEAEQRLLRQFHELPQEMQKFIANPQNTVYLDTAKRLSEMDVKQLRQIAESILEITW